MRNFLSLGVTYAPGKLYALISASDYPRIIITNLDHLLPSLPLLKAVDISRLWDKASLMDTVVLQAMWGRKGDGASLDSLRVGVKFILITLVQSFLCLVQPSCPCNNNRTILYVIMTLWFSKLRPFGVFQHVCCQCFSPHWKTRNC